MAADYTRLIAQLRSFCDFIAKVVLLEGRSTECLGLTKEIELKRLLNTPPMAKMTDDEQHFRNPVREGLPTI
jgi:hypothetical protein